MNWRKLLWWFTGVMQFGFLLIWGFDGFLTAVSFGFGFKHPHDDVRFVLVFAVFFLLWFFFRKVRRPFRGRYGLGTNWDWVRAYIRNWRPSTASSPNRSEKEMRDITP